MDSTKKSQSDTGVWPHARIPVITRDSYKTFKNATVSGRGPHPTNVYHDIFMPPHSFATIVFFGWLDYVPFLGESSQLANW